MTKWAHGTDPLAAALRTARRLLGGAALFSGLVNVLYLVPTLFMLQVYDRVVPTRGADTLVLLLVILLIALGVFAVLDLVRMRLLLRASVRLEKRTAPVILRRVLGAVHVTAAERASALRHFDTLRGTLTGPAIVALFDAPWIPIYLLVCFLLHFWIGVLATVSAVLLIVLAIAGDRATAVAVTVTARWSSLVSRSQDYSIGTAEVAQVLGMRDAIVRRHLFERANVVARQSDIAQKSGGLLALTKFLRLLFQSLALALGAWLAIRQSISAGAIFAASLLIGRALQPVEQILGAWKNILTAQMAYRDLRTFLAEADDTFTRTALPAPQGRIEVSDLTVRVQGSDRAILTDVRFTVEPGEIIAIVGPSGAGKSTLLRAMVGAIVPDRGEVRIDGASLADWDREVLGRYLGYMPQTPSLFPATVHANISRFAIARERDRNAVDVAVVEAATLAGAHDMILRMPAGYDTMLTLREDGGLSAGQRQLVAFSRALFGGPRLLFLDEPNAHLDMHGEAALMQVLSRARRGGVTVVVSTHRTGLLEAADRILLLRDGKVQFYRPRDEALRPNSEAGPSSINTAHPAPGASA